MIRRTLWFPPLAAALALAAHAQVSVPLGAEQGLAVFRSNCAFCHGADARGGRGPSLITAHMAASQDAEIRGIIKNGIPGTTMPAFGSLEKDDLDPLVTYLRSLASSGTPSAKATGDAEAGKAAYAANGCQTCHRIGFTGGLYGPELTRVGSGRSLEYIKESIVNPSADIPAGFEGVTVVEASGKKSTGIRINEDTFTLQLRLPNGKFASFDKTTAKSVTVLKQSLMPPYKLSGKTLDDLLAYLESLRGSIVTGDSAGKAKGIQ